MSGARLHRSICNLLTGRDVDVTKLKRERDDFALSLDAYDIKNFSVDEILKPYIYKAELVRRAGGPYDLHFESALNVLSDKRMALPLDRTDGLPMLLPGPPDLHKLMAVVCLLQHVRAEIDSPIFIHHAYRPQAWNDYQGGSKYSDHLDGSAIDVELTSKSAFRDFVKAISKFWHAEVFGLSFGWNSTGTNRAHVGAWAPETVRNGRQRWWDYARESFAPPF